jgi:hypothetical protein
MLQKVTFQRRDRPFFGLRWIGRSGPPSSVACVQKGRPVSSAAKQTLTGRSQRRALGLRARADGLFIVSQTGS